MYIIHIYGFTIIHYVWLNFIVNLIFEWKFFHGLCISASRKQKCSPCRLSISLINMREYKRILSLPPPTPSKSILRAYDRSWQYVFQHFLNRYKVLPICFGFSPMIENYRPRARKTTPLDSHGIASRDTAMWLAL